jgi:hypothetical protein
MNERRSRTIARFPDRRAHEFWSAWDQFGTTGSMTKCDRCGVYRKDHPVDFDRLAYLSLADEFDPIGASEPARLEDFDETYIDAARRFATRYAIPEPWVICSMDNALAYLERAEKGENHV